MTNEQILKKAIEKAIKGGLDEIWREDLELNLQNPYPFLTTHKYFYLIFSHPFAKAFFHCEHKLEEYKTGSFLETCKICKESKLIGCKWDNWQQHLQRMVLEEEPLKYLEKFL